MFARPRHCIFAALASIAGSAKKLQVRRITRSAVCDGNDVVDLKLPLFDTRSAAVLLPVVHDGNIPSRKGASVFGYLGAAVVLVGALTFGMSFEPFLDGLTRALSIGGNPSAIVFDEFGFVVSIVAITILLVLAGIFFVPFAVLLSGVRAIGLFPSGGGNVASLAKIWVGRISLREGSGAKGLAAFATPARPGKSFGNVPILAGIAREIALQSARQRFLPRYKIHPTLQNAYKGVA